MNILVDILMTRRFIPVLAALTLSAFLSNGCGSSRSGVEGYSDDALSGRRVFVVLPDEGEYTFTSAANFAWSRGIGEAGADGRIFSEFRTSFANALDARYDSNTVHNYATQSVGSTTPLSAETDFVGAPEKWNWSVLDVARKSAAIDFIVVINDVKIDNARPNDGGDRGMETVTMRARLVDMATRKVLADQRVSTSVSDPRQPIDTYVLLARELAEKLPFTNQFD